MSVKGSLLGLAAVPALVPGNTLNTHLDPKTLVIVHVRSRKIQDSNANLENLLSNVFF